MGGVCQGPKVSQQALVTRWSLSPPVNVLNAVGVYVELFVRQQDFDFKKVDIIQQNTEYQPSLFNSFLLSITHALQTEEEMLSGVTYLL